MSATTTCPRCGFANQVGQSFCTKCAGRLTSLGPSQGRATTQASSTTPWYEWTPASYSAVQKQGFERTQSGILLLMIGILLAPILSLIPYAVYVSDIFTIAGVIMVSLGRHVFGYRHSRFVYRAVNIYAFAFVAAIFNGALFILSLPGSSLVSDLEAFEVFFAGSIISGAVAGIAILFLTYALQNQVGRILLWAGYSSSVALGALTYYVVESVVASRGLSGLTNIQDQTHLLALLGLVPALMSALPLYKVRARILSGELTKNL